MSFFDRPGFVPYLRQRNGLPPDEDPAVVGVPPLLARPDEPTAQPQEPAQPPPSAPIAAPAAPGGMDKAAMLLRLKEAMGQDESTRGLLALGANFGGLAHSLAGQKQNPAALQMAQPHAVKDLETEHALGKSLDAEDRAGALFPAEKRAKEAGATSAEAKAKYAGDEALSDAEQKRAHAALFQQNAKKGALDLDEVERNRTALNDPTSLRTRVLISLAKKFAPGLAAALEGASGSDVSGVLPLMEKSWSAEELASARRAAASAAGTRRDDKAEADAGKTAAKRLSEFTTKTNPLLASSRSGLGSAGAVVSRGMSIMRLIGEGKSKEELDQINPQWVNEASAAMAALVTRGNAPALETIKQMVPNGMGMGTAQWQQWFTNAPKGAGQGAFLKKMLEAVEREDKGAKVQITRSFLHELAGYPDVVEKSPDAVRRVAQALGVHRYIDDKFNPSAGVLEALERGELPEEAEAKAKKAQPGAKVKVVGPGGAVGTADDATFDEWAKTHPGWKRG